VPFVLSLAMSMDHPPPPEPQPPIYPSPTSNVEPVAPPTPYQPAPSPGLTYQPSPPPVLPPYGQPATYAYRLPKSRTTAVLLAIFLGFITWMYTYEKDAWKFWTAFAITVGDGVLSVITLGFWLFVAVPVGLGLWVWGIIDTAARSQQFYDQYPAL
jgi:hypothetical protein